MLVIKGEEMNGYCITLKKSGQIAVAAEDNPEKVIKAVQSIQEAVHTIVMFSLCDLDSELTLNEFAQTQAKMVQEITEQLQPDLQQKKQKLEAIDKAIAENKESV
jgi:hypothetical protein